MIPIRKLLRPLLLACGWLLLVAALCGPHTRWSVCLSGLCRQHEAGIAAAPASGCCCRQHDAPARAELRDSECGNDASCPKGCCVDFMIALEQGPMPTPVVAPDLTRHLTAVLPTVPQVVATMPANTARFTLHNTGPPRPDARTALRATTVLRE